MANVLLIRTSMLSGLTPDLSHPLGIMYIASVLRERDHCVRITDLRVEPKGLEALPGILDDFEPDVVGISSLTVESDRTKQVAGLVKERLPAVRTLVGGPHATAYPETVLKNEDVDVAIIGEGEKTILELMPSLEKKEAPQNVRGIGLRLNGEIVINERQPYIEDLDSLPFPAWDLVNLEAYSQTKSMSTLNPRSYMTMFTSRSCPYGCIYCHQVFGKGFRARSPENVLEEMETIIRTYGIRDFELVDDIFNLDKKRVKRICDLIIQRNLNVRLAFPNGLRADLLDRNLIRSLKEAGTVSASFAIETATPRLQKLVRKNLILEKARESINYASEIGIISTGFFMLGFPTETREEVLRTIRFALKLKLHTAQFFLVTPFLGTEMATIFSESYKGVTDEFMDFDYNKGRYNISEVETEELFRLQRRANLKFYFRPSVAWRILRDYPDKRNVLARAVRLVRFKVLSRRRGTFVNPKAG